MSSIREAAIHLLESIDLPKGAANAMPISTAPKPYIKLLVDPSYMQRAASIPKRVDGFRVEVESRGSVFPMWA